MINEATLEARLHKVLENIFPTFREMNIVHQQSFSIKFGHRNVKVDLDDPTSLINRAVFDMLLKQGDTNIMLVELKKEGHPLDDEDVKQGLSYARLIANMPPLVLISNGVENLLYETYTMAEVEENSIDMDFIKGRIQSSFELSISEFKNAVNFLLNRQPELVGKIIRKISFDHFSYQFGNVDELHKPICPDFQISRSIVNKVYRAIEKEGGVIGVIGQAYSGKTCILYQFFRNYGFKKQHYVLYIDLKDSNFSIFQQLAQAFSRETKDNITKDKIREWFMVMLYTDPLTKFILLVDNLNKDVSEEITSEFLELIVLFRGTNHSVVYPIDEWSFNEIAYKANRNYKNIIGNLTKKFYIKDISDREFRRVNKWLFNCTRAIIQSGGHYCSEYRQTRILRNLAASYKKYSYRDDATYMQINPIVDFQLIEKVATNIIFSKETCEIYRHLVSAYFMDSIVRKYNAELNIIALNTGGMSSASIKKIAGDQEYEEVIKSGLVVEREYIKDFKIVIPQIPELFIFNAIDFITDFLKLEIDKKSFDEFYDLYLEICGQYPSGDIIGAEVLKRIGYVDVDLFTFIILELKRTKPVDHPIAKGTSALTFSENKGIINMQFNAEQDESFIVQHLPYSILSQLVNIPMVSENDIGEKNYRFFAELLYDLGSTPKFIHRLGYGSFLNAKPFLFVPIPQTGWFLSGKNGVIETLVQSYQKCFVIMPELLEALFIKASEEENYQVVWRVYLAVRTFTEITDRELAKKASSLKNQATLFIHQRMDEVLGINVRRNLQSEAL